MTLLNSVPPKARVLIVEDHPIVRHGLAMLIDNQPDLETVGGADTVGGATEQAAQLRPDVVVVDLTLADGNGLELIAALHAADPSRPVLALSMHDETLYAERALRAGAQGYVMKREAMDKLLVALRRVLAGQMFLTDRLAAHLAKKVIDRPATPLDALSDREFEVFRLLADDLRPSEIGRKLKLSVKTVETHRAHIKEKLGLKKAAELSRFLALWSSQRL